MSGVTNTVDPLPVHVGSRYAVSCVPPVPMVIGNVRSGNPPLASEIGIDVAPADVDPVDRPVPVCA